MPKVKVRIPTPLKSLTGSKEIIEIDAIDIKTLIDSLESAYPGIKERLTDENGAVRRFVNLYVNEENIRELDGELTKLEDGDEISVIPAIAGGRRR